MGKAVEFTTQFNQQNGSTLNADNGPAEEERPFAGGTVTITTDDLTPEVSAAILGLASKDLEEIPGVTDSGVKELLYGDNQEAPYLGISVVEKRKHDNVYKWRGIVLTKVMFSVPPDSAVTQGETITWKTPTLTGSILRDDSEDHLWKREATLSTEVQAEAFTKHRLNIR